MDMIAKGIISFVTDINPDINLYRIENSLGVSKAEVDSSLAVGNKTEVSVSFETNVEIDVSSKMYHRDAYYDTSNECWYPEDNGTEYGFCWNPKGLFRDIVSNIKYELGDISDVHMKIETLESEHISFDIETEVAA